MSSHLSTLLSGPKESHTQTEAPLAFLHTSTANHNHLYTPTAKEKDLCTLNEVKTLPPSHLETAIYSHSSPPSANFQVASSFQTQHRIEVKIHLHEEKQDKQNIIQ